MSSVVEPSLTCEEDTARQVVCDVAESHGLCAEKADGSPNWLDIYELIRRLDDPK